MRSATRRPSEGGFTLVELMTVVLIVGILVTIAVASYFSAVRSSQRVVCLDNQRMFESAVNFFLADHDGTEPTSISDLEPYVGLYNTAHKCPTDGRTLVFDPSTLEFTCTYPGHTR